MQSQLPPVTPHVPRAFQERTPAHLVGNSRTVLYCVSSSQSIFKAQAKFICHSTSKFWVKVHSRSARLSKLCPKNCICILRLFMPGTTSSASCTACPAGTYSSALGECTQLLKRNNDQILRAAVGFLLSAGPSLFDAPFLLDMS